ncbi:MAG: UpxY family transcription antiterminator [Bacteroidales bacterium]|nr:UpxY family transcription antiterminator [Bacteroidales bacterium]
MTPDDQILWYVMRAYKAEKKAEEMLSGDRGLEFFIAKQYAVREYHGVKSKYLVPAIPGMVFVRASHNQIVEFKQHGGNFLQFVTRKTQRGPEYLTVPDSQMDNFIKVASRYDIETTYFSPDEVDLGAGARVRILGGPFNGVTGVFMRVKGKRNRRLVVQLEGITTLATEIAPDLIEVIKENN